MDEECRIWLPAPCVTHGHTSPTGIYASPTEHPLFLFSMKVRNNRPGREKTMDDVEGVLIRQQGLVGAFQEKVGVRRM